MTRKRNFWILLVAAVLIGALVMAACQPEQATEEPTEEATEEPTEEATEEPMEEETEEPMEEETEEPMEETEEPMEDSVRYCDDDLSGESITFYQQAGLTGPLATILGEGFVNGTEDAVREINESGGICGAEIVVDLTDTQYEAEQEIEAFQQSLQEDPDMMFVLTYASPASVGLKELVNENKVVNLAAGLNAQAFYVPRNGWTVGVAPIYPDQFAGFLQWASENWDDIKPEGAGDDITVGVIGWEGPFGAGATTEESLAYAEELGVTVLPLETVAVSPEADVTSQVQSVVSQGANVIYVQSLGFGPVQVIATVRALDLWDSVVVGGVNWAMNQDVLNYLGENKLAANGFYGVFPYSWWNDTDNEGVQMALAAFEEGGYPESQKDVGYLLSYGSIYGLQTIIEHAIDTVGYENLNGEAFFEAFEDLGTVSAAGLFEWDVRGETRSPSMAQIRQWQATEDGDLEYVIVQDFFELPSMRPPEE